MSLFKPAQKKQAKLRLALTGPSGSGKTFSALSIAAGLGEHIAVIDTEHGSASLYSDRFKFVTCELDHFDPDKYVEAIKEAETWIAQQVKASGGQGVIIIDSLSHAWMGTGGALEQVDNATRRSGSKNSYFAWRDVTPKHNALVEAIVQSTAHVIATMRAKTEYALDKDDKGKVMPRKIGLAPVQRDGMEYEFTIAGELDLEHNYNVTKTRCSELAGKCINKPGAQVAKVLKAWLENGAQEAPPKPELKPAVAPARTVHVVTDDDQGNTKTVEVPVREGAPMTKEQLRSAIAAATSLEALEYCVPEIQKLPKAEQAEIRPDFAERKRVLKAEGKVAAPGPTGAEYEAGPAGVQS